VARGDQDGEFLETLRQGSVEAYVFAEFLRAVRELRLRSSALNGPRTPPRGPDAISS